MKVDKEFVRRAILALMLLLLLPGSGYAVTRGEMLAALWGELSYNKPALMELPPDVPQTHPYAKQIGYAVRYGLMPKGDFFLPDDAIDRHDAVRMSLMMMGWGFEVSLYESLATLPDLSGSGDSVFFLAAEMQPPAPQNILIDGFTPLSETAKSSLLAWVRQCKKSVRWNRVMPFDGTDLIIFRQGVALPGVPNTPGEGNPVGAPANEPIYVAAIAVDPTLADQRIAFAEQIGRPRATPSEFASLYEPIGLINGGFFAGARPVGTMLTDGQHAGRPLEGRSAVGWNNGEGTFVFGPGQAAVGARTAKGYVEFTRFNTAPQDNEAALYNASVAVSSIGVALDALQLVVVGGVVTERREGSENNHWLPEGSTMIVARGNARSQLEEMRPGDKVTFITDWETEAFRNCSDLIQAGPMLVRNGTILSDVESFKPDITDKRHPRTIMGTDGRRMIWAVIDGRSSLHSRGATMDETRWIAKSLGLQTAINMDGGGSSQLIWRGVLVNSPSDGKERPLPYTVMVLPKGAQLARRSTLDQGEFGTYGYTVEDEREAVFMDVYDPTMNR